MNKDTLIFDIAERMCSYYTSLYRDDLGLPDWEKRVNRRLNEDENIDPYIKKFELWSGISIQDNCKILIVGGGTGAEFVNFAKRGCDVHAIEPNEEAVAIACMKADCLGIDRTRFIKACAENIPLATNTFDLVWCFTVIEHVQDVRKSLEEMVRVTRPGGAVFLVTPDYRFCIEPHYKLHMPTFAPLFIQRLWLLLKGRPRGFIGTINFLNRRKMARIFQKLPVTSIQVMEPLSLSWQHSRDLFIRFVVFLSHYFGAHHTQLWILRKMEEA